MGWAVEKSRIGQDMLPESEVKRDASRESQDLLSVQLRKKSSRRIWKDRVRRRIGLGGDSELVASKTNRLATCPFVTQPLPDPVDFRQPQRGPPGPSAMLSGAVRHAPLTPAST